MFENDKSEQDVIFISRRMRMVEEQIIRRGITDQLVLNAMRIVPRHKFVPERLKSEAYHNCPLPISENQTISQPYIVASMTEELEINNNSKVLEIGTGSGYQTAILAEIVKELYSLEIIPSLHYQAKVILKQMGYKNINLFLGDGNIGLKSQTDFDGIIVTAAAKSIPEALIAQLRVGGIMVIPIEERQNVQNLMKIIKKDSNNYNIELLYPVRFVPLVGGL